MAKLLLRRCGLFSGHGLPITVVSRLFTRRRCLPHAQPPTWRLGCTYLKLDVGGKGKSVRQYPRTRLQDNRMGNLECSDKKGVE